MDAHSCSLSAIINPKLPQTMAVLEHGKLNSNEAKVLTELNMVSHFTFKALAAHLLTPIWSEKRKVE